MPANKTILLLVCLLLLATGMFGQANDSENTLLLRSGVKKTMPDNARDFFQQPSLFRKSNETDLLIRFLQFYELPTADQRSELADYDIKLLQYVSNRTYIAAIPTGIDLPNHLQQWLRSVGPILADHKVAPSLTPEAQTDPHQSFTLQYHPVFSEEAVLSFLRKQQLNITEHLPAIRAITIETIPDQLTEIAQWPMISNIEAATTAHYPEDEIGHSHHRSNLLNSLWNPDRHFNGEGVRIALGEDGFIGPHIDLRNRTHQDDLVGDLAGTHGEMVAGILAGAGNIHPSNKGIADGAELFVLQEFNAVKEADILYQEQQVVLTNTAFSDGCNRGYTTLAQLADQQSYNYPALLHIFSAGNAGQDDCEYGAGQGWGTITGGVKAGKNVLAVANLNLDGQRVLSSSKGPANDGRIKPDIAAFGDGQTGLAPNNEYQPGSGTSAAAPVVTGILAQLYQAYREMHNNNNPPSALLKASLLNSADDLGNSGPDYSYGWGKANAFRAFDILDKSQWMSGTLDHNEIVSFEIEVPPTNVQQLRVMVYWHDKEGSPISFKSLINDLDMTVTDPSGTTHLPWVLQSAPDSALLDLPAQKGTDHLNNVEQVSIEFPETGIYSIQLTGFEVPVGPQEFFVVYHFETDDLVLTYPNGGENLAPGEEVLIHWEAFGNNAPFSLEYSDNQGDSWQPIATVAGHLRQTFWTAPNLQSGKMMVRVSRNNKETTNEHPFSICDPPTNLEVEQVCPSYIRLQWDTVAGATGYIVYQLGSTHMDSVAFTEIPTIDIPISDPEQVYWLSVSTLGQAGAKSRRNVAVSTHPGLVDCISQHDLALVAIASPAVNNLSECFSLPIPVSVNIKNTGSSFQSDFWVYYQFNDQPVVASQWTGSVPPGTTVNHTFETPITTGNTGLQKLRVWTGLTNDEATYNDTLRFQFSVVPGTVYTLPYFENFDEFELCPAVNHCALNCLLENDWRNAENDLHDEIDWRVYKGATPSYGTGPETDQNNGIPVGKYLYLEGAAGCFEQLATLASPCIDLTGAQAPQLSFWYHMDGSDMGSLQVDLFDGSEWHFNITTALTGNQGSGWHKATVDLTAFAGQLVVLQWRGRTGNGILTDLAIDNLAVYDAQAPPWADFTVDKNRSCTNEPLRFYDNSFNETLSWNWTITPTSFSFLENTNENSQHPVIQFHETTLYSIELTATNAYGSSTKSIADYIHISDGMSLPFVQTFEGNNFPPLQWELQNHDNDIGWSPASVVGKDGQISTTAFMNNFSYNKTNEEDVLRSPVINLANATAPLLRFDYSYVSYSSNYADQLSVLLSDDCGNSYEHLLFEKSGNELATASNQIRAWAPETTMDWETAIVDLSSFAGLSVALRFVNFCQFGNNLYLDNIAVYEAGDFPVAGFEATGTTVCVGESLTFSNTSSGNGLLNYQWQFGANNTPPIAAAPGPHEVLFTQAGTTPIILVADNDLGTDIASEIVEVIDVPIAGFSISNIPTGVQFWNESTFGESYFWEFGDGQTSTDPNPVHTYPSPGVYEVSLTVTNPCGSHSIAEFIDVSSSTHQPGQPFGIRVYPNPASERIVLDFHNPISANGTLEITTINGRSLEVYPLHLPLQHLQIDIGHLPVGLYLLRFQMENQFFTQKIAVFRS